ncbi:hypothetical protein CRYUN_Cryun17cG0032200 [Craigia yunnanensis]
MSSKRSSSRSNENEDFSLKLRDLLTTNNHIKRLNGEVDDLSNRISELMASPDIDSSIKSNILKQLLQQ